MKKLELDYTGVLRFVSEKEINSYEEKAKKALDDLLNKNGLGHEYLGWLNQPNEVTDEEILDILETSKKIQDTSDYLVVVGIGGSYLGAKAGLDFLGNYFPKKGQTEVIFLGNTLSSSYTSEVLEFLKNKEFSVNVISKSGTTIEPAIAFRLLRKLLDEKYGEEAKNRIYVTTDKSSGVLREMAEREGYKSFVLQSDIGGRYSVLTPVGLLPMSVVGVDITKVIKGAREARSHLLSANFMDNEALLYASIRNILYQEKGKKIELLASFEPSFRFLTEWWKQLFGESEGKNHLGIIPASIIYSADLHSMGQLIQEGERSIFETIVSFRSPRHDLNIHLDADNLDKLNYVVSFKMSEVNDIALRATSRAHIDGGVPLIEIILEEIDECNFGYLVYFFMLSCAVSGYLLGINPFNQEGVEYYKRNMVTMLNNPGNKNLKEELEK